MSVTVDDRPLPADKLGFKTVGQVLAHLKKDNRLIVHVKIDGEEPDPKRIRTIKKFPLSGHTVFIQTADPRDMARQFLDEVDAQLTEADRLKCESARLLGNKQFAPAMEKLGGCFKTWQHAQDSLMKTAQLLRIDPQRIKVRGKALTELMTDFTTHLRQIRTALEGRDFTTLADLLAHKMSRAFEQWRDAVRCFRGVILVYSVTIRAMPADLQARCELGQQQLMRTDYLEAEATLASAEADAWEARDFDTLSRVYMPLQETRRQIRQRCTEGAIALDLIASGPDDTLDPEEIIRRFPTGQLLVAGWGSITAASRLRELQRERKLYLETFLAAVYPIAGGGRAVAITPLQDVKLPDAQPRPIDDLIRKLPAHCIVLGMNELSGADHAAVMSMWERLHKPFLAAADMQIDPVQKISAYRKTQRVDYACELAHQKASDVARQLARESRRNRP